AAPESQPFSKLSWARSLCEKIRRPTFCVSHGERLGSLMNLNVLLEPAVDLPRLQKILDELGHLGRVDTIRGWDKKTQAQLYEAARGFRLVTLDDFVPPSAEPLQEIIHHGKNTLPSFSHFQKRFCKSEGEAKELMGYNHQQMMWATGPGYFV